MSLIQFGWFRTHSGLQLPWKLDADALSDETIAELAKIIASSFSFGDVVGIPRGGLRLAKALLPYAKPRHPILIVDDVLTTGASMEKTLSEVREQFKKDEGRITTGVVIFARGPCPNWVLPIFTVNEWAQ